MNEISIDRGRRRFLRAALVLPLVLAEGMRLRWPVPVDAGEAGRPAVPSGPESPPARDGLAPTPDCGDDDEPTPAETEGPFYKPRSPRRSSLLEPGITGTKIVLDGRAYSRRCRPLAGVLIDFWHADRYGEYDNVGFRLRGHQFTDEKGRYRLESIVPGLYPGRTRHFHVKVQPPNGRVLTTQLYFPGEARNREDRLFRSDLLMAVKDGSGGKDARFHFVLDLA